MKKCKDLIAGYERLDGSSYSERAETVLQIYEQCSGKKWKKFLEDHDIPHSTASSWMRYARYLRATEDVGVWVVIPNEWQLRHLLQYTKSFHRAAILYDELVYRYNNDKPFGATSEMMQALEKHDALQAAINVFVKRLEKL